MEARRWVNPTQPQTLQIAVMLLYISALFDVVYGALGSTVGLAVVVAGVAAGFGIANERKWGYGLGVARALFPFVIRLLYGGVDAIVGTSLLNLMFEIALVALLLHTQSREYQRIWFK